MEVLTYQYTACAVTGAEVVEGGAEVVEGIWELLSLNSFKKFSHMYVDVQLLFDSVSWLG